MSETLFTGQPGPKGDKGEPGMPRLVRRAIIFLFCFSVLLSGVSLFASARYADSLVRASQRASAASQKATAASQKASAAGQKAGAASVSVTDLCQAGNAARAQQVGLWTFLIRLSKPPRTADQRRLLARFEHHLRVVFAPQNCTLPRPGGKETS